VTLLSEAKKISDKIGYPVLVKAVSGGGGRGMKVAETEKDLEAVIQMCQREAQAAFGDSAVYIEKFLSGPRHIEVQVLGDGKGNAIHLWERDCSIQRRHQKVLEEAPSIALSQKERKKICESVQTAVAQMGYRGAGTVEFLYENGEFYFIEMNTRIQVEHPVTEAICGIDLLCQQIKIAAGEEMETTVPTLNGHSIECRINAEDPETFMPMPGTVEHFHTPGGPGVRIDSALYTGYKIPPFYDSMIAKLIVHAENREKCLARLRRSLEEFVISGVTNTIPFHRRLVNLPDFIEGKYNINWLESILAQEK
jgi:acetyl-CoA carboxylase biotin carboxylase subunit